MSGIVSELMKPLSIMGINLQTTMSQNVIRFELSENDLRSMLLHGVDDRVKPFVGIRIENNKIVVEIKIL